MRPSLALLVLFSLAASGCSASSTAAPPPPPAAEDAAIEPGQRSTTLVIPSIAGIVADGWIPDWSGFAGTSTGCMRSIGAGRFAVLPTLAEGDRMLSLVVAIDGDLSADVTVTSVAVAPNGDRFLGTVANLTIPNVASGFHDYPIEMIPTTVVDGVEHWFEFGADQAGACVGAVRLTYDHSQT